MLQGMTGTLLMSVHQSRSGYSRLTRLQHADVHNMLFRIAQDAGVEIRLGCLVMSVNPYMPSVTLDSGEVVRGDIVVGADGGQSYVRSVVFDYYDPGVPKGTAVYM